MRNRFTQESGPDSVVENARSLPTAAALMVFLNSNILVKLFLKKFVMYSTINSNICFPKKHGAAIFATAKVISVYRTVPQTRRCSAPEPYRQAPCWGEPLIHSKFLMMGL